MRLRARGVLVDLQRPEVSWDRAHPHRNTHLISEVNALLKVDRPVLDALATLTQPYTMTYRCAPLLSCAIHCMLNQSLLLSPACTASTHCSPAASKG